MKAIVVEQAGAPEVLQIRTLPRPQPRSGWVLIQVKALVIHEFEPMAAIPSTVKLTHYSTETVTAANSAQALQQIVDGVAAGRYRVSIDKVFHFNEIVEAHRYMEENRAKGKLVVVVD